MDGNSKEEFCSMCSVEVPSAFKDDEEKDDIVNEKEKCKWISKWFLKILMILIVTVFIYFLLKKP
jgi:hypothetical protein